MLRENLLRYGGLAAMLAGGLRSVNAFLSNTASGIEVLYLFTDIFLLLAIIGLHAVLRGEASSWGVAGYRLALLGVGVLLVNDFLSAWINLYAVGALIFAGGLCLLAIVAWIANKFPRWIPAFWILSTLLGIVGFFVSELNLLFVLSGVLFGLSFVGAGVEIWRLGGEA